MSNRRERENEVSRERYPDEIEFDRWLEWLKNTQWTYFIQAGEDGPIKIGTSMGRNLHGRLRSLQCGNPQRLRVVGVTTSSENPEYVCYACWSHLRIMGEWFQATEELCQWIMRERHPKGFKARDPMPTGAEHE